MEPRKLIAGVPTIIAPLGFDQLFWATRMQSLGTNVATIARRLEDDRAVVPPVWGLEFVNVLRTSCVRQRMDAQAAQAVIARVLSLPIEVDREGTAPPELLALSLRFGLRSYDASYLALALRLQVPLATQDDALRAAALASGAGLAS